MNQTNTFVPLQADHDSHGPGGTARRSVARRVTVGFAFVAPVVAWLIVLLAVYPDVSLPLWARGALLLPRLVMVLAGIWLIDSIRWGYRLSLLSLVVAIGTSVAVVTGMPDASRVVRLELAGSVVLPALGLVLLANHLMRLRRASSVRTLF
ncbi:MAG: hypothetical protein QM589_18080 [Thermomicrobiales bacterium]